MKITFKIRVKKMQYKFNAKKRNLMIKFIKFLVKKTAAADVNQKILKRDIIFLLQVEKEKSERINRYEDD